MIRVTLLLVSVVAVAQEDAVLLAQTDVVVSAGTSGEPRGGNQFELAMAAAAGFDDENQAITSGLVHVKFMSSLDGIETIRGAVEQVEIFHEDGTPIRANLACTAQVKLRDGRRFLGVEGVVSVSDKRKQSLYFPEVMLEPIQDAVVYSGGNIIGTFEPELLVVALGEATEVETDFQAAVAIGPDGQAIGHLALVANRDNGDLVHVEGDVSRADLRAYRGRRRLQLQLIGSGAVDVVRPDGTSPDICVGAFSFVSNEGPHGPYRLDMPDCGDPLAGIEGSDIGSGAQSITAASWPPPTAVPFADWYLHAAPGHSD